MDPGGEPTSTTWPNQHNLQQQSKYLSLFPKVSVVLTSIKEILFATVTITENHNQT